jgi:hypothetical protein
MSNRQKQEEAESFYIKEFLQRMEIKSEHIERGEDPPDFYIVYKSNRIAVELTDYHSVRKSPRGHSWRAVEEERRKIRALFIKEKEQYPKLNDVLGCLYFRELEMPPAKEHGQFVTELLEFGISQCETLTKEVSWFRSFPSNYPLLNRYLKKIHLQKAGRWMPWNFNSSAWVGITEEELGKCVSKKLQTPRPVEVDENWLLVVSGNDISQQIGSTPCETFNGFAELHKCFDGSAFDKIFFFQYVWGRVLCWSPGKQWEEIKSAETGRGINPSAACSPW